MFAYIEDPRAGAHSLRATSIPGGGGYDGGSWQELSAVVEEVGTKNFQQSVRISVSRRGGSEGATLERKAHLLAVAGANGEGGQAVPTSPSTREELALTE